MILFKVVTVLVLLNLSNADDDDDVETLLKDAVTEFNDDDFESSIAQYETALVMFQAPWCKLCKELRPEYDMAAYRLKTNDPPIIFGIIDCETSGKKTCEKMSVTTYPKLKVFKNGEYSHDYDGRLLADGFINYMLNTVGPIKEISTNVELEELLKGDKVVVVGFFKDESEFKKKFTKIAYKLRDRINVVLTSSDELLNQYSVDNSFIIFRLKYLRSTFEEDELKYKGADNEELIENFIRKNIHGLVGLRTEFNHIEFKSPIVIAYYNIDYKKNVKGTNYWRNRILKVAKQFADQFTFAICDKETFQAEYLEADVQPEQIVKPFIFAKDEKDRKFVMQKDFSVEAFEEFMKDLKDDKLEPILKSLPIPESNDGFVKIAVAKTFKEIVLDNNKDTMLQFFSPWCSHCRNLEPVYENLGIKMEKEDVEIVKMDAVNNAIPNGFTVNGYPTIYWLKKDDKQNPVLYTGDRDVKDFIKFIAQHSTNELEGYSRKGYKKKTEL